MNNSLSKLSRILLLLTAVLLIATLFLPLWLIELDAPQYPEGLELKIYTDGLGGQVDIINGLNHYIGMATLHSENFIEFTLLPYIIGFFALVSVVVAFWAKRSLLMVLFVSFLLFGVISMADFWRWEYDYGHNLDPNAAIIVPGMAYQPPLIGFKQLLNFGAYSIPDIGGWFIIVCGVLMLSALIIETDKIKNMIKNRRSNAMSIVVVMFFSLGLMSCSSSKQEPIALNKDACENCKMTISDGRFAAEIITEKGRCYKFDDILCMSSYFKEHEDLQAKYFFVNDFHSDNVLINASTGTYIKTNELKSPMGGNTAAVVSNEVAKVLQRKFEHAELVSWNDILNH
jgi:copper chaperone NosL